MNKFHTSDSDCNLRYKTCDDLRKQLVLPKVGSHRPPQMSIQKPFSIQILQTLLKGDLLIDSRIDSLSTPFLPPITSHSTRSTINATTKSRYRCKLPSPKQVLSPKNNNLVSPKTIPKSIVPKIETDKIQTTEKNNLIQNQNSPVSSRDFSARWKSSIPKELQSTIKTENVIRKDKMSKRSNIHQVYTVKNKK